MQLYHLHVPAGFTVWVSLFCVYLGSKAIEGGKKMYTCSDLLVMKTIINYNSILNVTATELLYNRAITKMASMNLMLGHSEDYVSVLSCGLVHTVPTANLCHSSSSVSLTTEIKLFLLKSHTFTCLKRNKDKCPLHNKNTFVSKKKQQRRSDAQIHTYA